MTIQAGIDAAPINGTIVVAPGTYNEIVNAARRELVSSGGAAVTVIDGTGLTNPIPGVVSSCSTWAQCDPWSLFSRDSP